MTPKSELEKWARERLDPKYSKDYMGDPVWFEGALILLEKAAIEGFLHANEVIQKRFGDCDNVPCYLVLNYLKQYAGQVENE